MSYGNEKITYKWARDCQWAPAMDLVWRTYLRFEGDVYTQEGNRNFYEFITDRELHQSFLEGRYLMMLALEGEKVVGVATLRNRNHLSLLFVDEAYHRQGIGRALLQEMENFVKTRMEEQHILVKSSPYAVEFYQRVGFRTVAPPQSVEGMLVTPMLKEL